MILGKIWIKLFNGGLQKMTVKELARLLKLSKGTISNKIKKLGIEPIKNGNKYVLQDADIITICKEIYPSDYQKYLVDGNINENKNAQNRTKPHNHAGLEPSEEVGNAQNAQNRTKPHNHAGLEPSEEVENAQNAQNRTKPHNHAGLDERLFEVLQKALEEKENTIKAQQNQIDMLIKSNAMLINKIALLEDKSQEPSEEVEPFENDAVAAGNTEPEPQQEKTQKEGFWKRIFSH